VRIARSTARVFVISGNRTRAILEPSPGGPVALRELLVGSVRIGKVAGGKHSARNAFNQTGCGPRSGEIATTGDIARPTITGAVSSGLPASVTLERDAVEAL